jgi:hypothetical protein
MAKEIGYLTVDGSSGTLRRRRTNRASDTLTDKSKFAIS